MSRGASRPAAPSPGSTVRRPRFATRGRRLSPTPTAGLAVTHACRCPDPSRIASDSTRAVRRRARCSGFRCRGRDCRESCWDSRESHQDRDSAPRSAASRAPSATRQRHSRGISGGSLPLRPQRFRARRSRPRPRATCGLPCSRSRDRRRISRAPHVRAVRVESCPQGL